MTERHARYNTDKAEIFAHWWQVLAQDAAQPVREYQFAKTIGRNWKTDFAWPGTMLIVEIDGGQWAQNGGRHARDTDRDKLNAAAVLGYTVIRFSPEQLSADPQRCVDIVRAALYGAEPEQLADLFRLQKRLRHGV